MSSSSSSSSSGLGLLDSKLPMRDLTGKYARFRNEFFLSSSHSHLRSIHSSPPPHSSLSGPLLQGNSASSAMDMEDHGLAVTLRPEWADIHDQVEADMRQVKESISTLKTLHKTRCGINFNEAEVKQQEEEIEILTQMITTKLRKCESGIKRIALVGDVAHLSAKERNVRLNSMRMLAQDLSFHSKAFRVAQKDFLRSLNDQQGKNKDFGFTEDETVKSVIDEDTLDQNLTEEQRQQLEQLSLRANEREKEILRIAKSIHELATLFSELNVLVIEQGTVLDRIDYNIEQTLVSVNKGNEELGEAERISRRALTCKCLIALTIVVIILIGILIWKKSKKSSNDDGN